MAGLIPQSFIDDLLSRADIVDVVDSRVNLKKTGKNYSGLCPFHQEKSPSFTVEPDKQFYYCFGCGAGGGAINFIMNYENLDFPQAIEFLADSMGIDVPRDDSAAANERREQNQGLYDILHHAAAFYKAQLRKHPDKDRAINYLKERGLSGEIVRDFGLGYAPPGWDNLLRNVGTSEKAKQQLLNGGMSIEKPENKKNPLYDRFRDRIMYPIKDRRGRVIGFGGRVLGDDKPKYLNSPETPIFHKGEELYGLYEARQKVRKLERFVIVEGYMDVIALAQNNIHYCVATLGTATSASHLRQLFKLVPEIVFCFDGDNAGRDAAWRALIQTLPLMEDGLSARFLFLPDGEDPDSQVRKIGNQAFVKSIEDATQLADFFFEHLSAQVNIDSLEGRAKLGTLAMPHISKLPQGIFHQLILAKLSQITGVDQQILNQHDTSSAAPVTTTSAPAIPSTYEESAPQPYQPMEERFAPHIETAKKTYNKNSNSHSVCMRAINLILLKPDIVQHVESIDALQEIQALDIDLLLQVIQLAKAKPNCTTPELLGRLYATPFGDQVVQLFDKEQLLSHDSIEKEFIGFISRFVNEHQRQKDLSSRLEQARQNQLSRRQTAKTGNDSQNNN